MRGCPLDGERSGTLRRAANKDGHQPAFKLMQKCWGIMLARYLQVRFDKSVIKTGPSKSPVHEFVPGQSLNVGEATFP
jgi:hypothetical protein